MSGFEVVENSESQMRTWVDIISKGLALGNCELGGATSVKGKEYLQR